MVHVDENFTNKREMPFPELPQRLEGAEVGVVREFDLEIPSDYGSDQIAGKTARFVVTVNDVKERRLPELDDEFAKGVGEDCDTLDALRESVRDQLQAAAEESAERLYKEAAVDELLANATVELAPLSVDREIDRSMGHRARLSEMLGVPVEDFLRQFGTTEEEVRESTRETAVKDLTRSYALATLAEAEDLEVAEDEVEERVREMLAADGGRRQGSRQDRRRERDRLRTGVEAQMMETKSLGRLVDIAKGGADTDAADHEEQDTEGERVDT
jgi:trigger factor